MLAGVLSAQGSLLPGPALAACLLAALPGYRLTSRLNVLATFLTFATAVSLFVVEPSSGPYLLVDDLNKVFIVLTTFVSFTTSVFSASYIGHEIKIGRLNPEPDGVGTHGPLRRSRMYRRDRLRPHGPPGGDGPGRPRNRRSSGQPFAPLFHLYG